MFGRGHAVGAPAAARTIPGNPATLETRALDIGVTVPHEETALLLPLFLKLRGEREHSGSVFVVFFDEDFLGLQIMSLGFKSLIRIMLVYACWSCNSRFRRGREASCDLLLFSTHAFQG